MIEEIIEGMIEGMKEETIEGMIKDEIDIGEDKGKETTEISIDKMRRDKMLSNNKRKQCRYKFPCRYKFLCLQFQDKEEKGSDPDHHFHITQEIKTITKETFGIHSPGFPE